MKNEKYIVGLGEMMLRLTAPRGRLIPDAGEFNASYGGGEANVLISLSHLNHKTKFLTRLPINELGFACKKKLLAHEVDCSSVIMDNHTLGMYFVDIAEGSRSSNTLYNRKHSSASHMKVTDFNFDEIFKDASVFYLTGITLAISKEARDTALLALKKAKEHNIKVIFDFNYRSRLLSLEEAKKIYPEVINYCDVVFASPFDFKTLIGFESDETDNDKLFFDALKAFNLNRIYTKTRKIIACNEHVLNGISYSKNGKAESGEMNCLIYDRIGAGDAYSAGIVHGYLSNYSEEKTLQLGIANAILKQSLFGDYAKFNEATLEEFLIEKGKGEIKR